MPEAIGLAAILNDAAFQNGVQRYQQGVSKMEASSDQGASVMSKIWSTGAIAVAAGAAAVAVGIAGITAVAKTGLDTLTSWNEQVNTLSDNLGTTGEQSSAWAVAFQHVGLSVEEGSAGLNFFVKNLDNVKKAVPGTKQVLTPFEAALQKLGVSAFTASGKLRTFDQITPEILDAFQKMPPGIQKTALAMDLFGARGGTKFIDFLSQGSAGLEKARQMAKAYGLELDTDLSSAVEDFGFAMNDVNLGIKGFWVTIGKAVLPVATKFVNFVTDNLIPPLIDFAKFIAPQLSAALGGVIDIFTSIFNAVRVLATGDFRGGIFGLTEDDPWIDALFKGREAIVAIIGLVKDIVSFARTGDISDVFSDLTDFFGEDLAGGISDVLEIARDLFGVLRDFGVELSQGKIEDAFRDLFAGLDSIWTNDLQPMLAGWAVHIWDWLNAAAAAAPAKLTELTTAIFAFLNANGPAVWAALKDWGAKFWNWLTVDVIPFVSSKLLVLTASIGAWLSSLWTTSIQPSLLKWGLDFWNWLTGDGGVLDQIAPKMVELTLSFLQWSQGAGTQKNLEDTGANIAVAVIDAVGALFGSATGQEKTDSAMNRFMAALGISIGNMGDAFSTIAAGIVTGIETALIEKLLGRGISPELREALRRFIALAFGLPVDILAPLSPATQGATNATTPGPDGSSTTQSSQLSTSGGAGTATVQAVPLNLQVQIGTTQISEAVATWSAVAAGEVARDAVAQIKSSP